MKNWRKTRFALRQCDNRTSLLSRRNKNQRRDGKGSIKMNSGEVRFSIASEAAWAPGVETPDAWVKWADDSIAISGGTEPAVKAMAPMLRRRAGALGKMALEVAYQCLGERVAVPMVFCSRHGEVSRSVELLTDLAQGAPLSPTAFGLSVHNASAGLFTIARGDRTNNMALAGGHSTVEHAVIEACGLLADGEAQVLLVTYDNVLPALYSDFHDCDEQPHAWAWLLQASDAPGAGPAVSLAWAAADRSEVAANKRLSGGLEILRFHLRKESQLNRVCDGRQWRWSRHA
jgi:hypothetical protein